MTWRTARFEERTQRRAIATPSAHRDSSFYDIATGEELWVSGPSATEPTDATGINHPWPWRTPTTPTTPTWPGRRYPGASGVDRSAVAHERAVWGVALANRSWLQRGGGRDDPDAAAKA